MVELNTSRKYPEIRINQTLQINSRLPLPIWTILDQNRDAVTISGKPFGMDGIRGRVCFIVAGLRGAIDRAP